MSNAFTDSLWFVIVFSVTCGMVWNTCWLWIDHKTTVERLLEQIANELRNRK